MIKNMKLHNKLLASYLIACIIPLLLSSQIIYRFSVRNLESTLLEMMNIFNSQIISNIDNFISEYDNITKSVLVDQEIVMQNNLGSDPSINTRINNQLAMRKILLRLETLKPEIDRIMLFTADGELFQYGKTNDGVDVELLKEKEWFQTLVQSPKTLTIVPLHDTSYYTQDKNRTIVTVGRVILDSGGRYSGVLLLDLKSSDLVRLNEEFLAARTNYNIKLTVANARGAVLYHSDTLTGQTTLAEISKTGYVAPEGEDFITMSELSSYGDLVVYTEIPRSDLLLKVRNINFFTLVATIFSFLIALFMSLIFSHSITKPIKSLKKSMKSAEKGNYVEAIAPNITDEMGTLVASYNQMIIKTKSLIEEVYLAEIEQKNARFLALQTQINPHMLYNTFESIRMKALINGDDETAEMIKILSRLFRASLSQDASSNSVQTEINYLEDYLKLQNIRFEDRFQLEVVLNDEIRQNHLIALTLQPLVENCIKHGGLGKSHLHIVITGEITEDNDILLTISDDGVGMTESEIEEINRGLSSDTKRPRGDTQSIGLKNIAERLSLHYGSKYYIKIVPAISAGTSIEMLIPRQLKDQPQGLSPTPTTAE